MKITACNPPRYGTNSLSTKSLVAILFLISAAGCTDQKQQAEELVRTAIQHHEADRPIEALQQLHRAIALNPGLAEAFYLRGTCYGEMHKQENAIEDLATATRLKPDWDEAWCALGIAQLSSGDAEHGIISLTKALELTPQMLTALEARIQGFHDLNRVDEELRDLEALLQIDAENNVALVRRATLLAQSNPARAIEDLSKMISRDRENATAWLNRGLCYSQTGDTDRALADLNMACRFSSEGCSPWLERGRILRKVNRFDDAVSDLSKAAELAPNEFAVRLELGRAYLDKSNLDAAAANFLQAERLSQNSRELQLSMAHLEIQRGQNDTAIERLKNILIDEASLSAPLMTAVRVTLAEQLRSAGENTEAMAHLQKALTAEPNNTVALRIRADLLANSNRREEAIQDYTRLISANSAVKSAALAQSVFERGRLHLDGQEWYAATADFTQYLLDHPDDVETLSLRARSRLGEHDPENAIADLTRALLKKPDAPELYLLRAEAFEQFNAHAAALADMQKVASLQPENGELLFGVAERLYKDRQFAKAAMTLDTLAESRAGQLSRSERLLRCQARLADGNLAGAYEDVINLSADTSVSLDSEKAAELVLLQATIALRRHDDTEALRLIPQLSESAVNSELLLFYGEALARKKQWDESIRVFTKLLQAEPSNAPALVSRASAYLASDDVQAALDDANQLLQTTPDDHRALIIKGTCLFKNGNFREALDVLDNPILISRNSVDARWMRIQCCSSLQLTFREMEELNALLGIEPTHEVARLLRAQLLEQLGHFDDAIADLTAAFEHNQKNLSAMTSRALLNQRRGNAVAAVEDFTAAIALSPDDAVLYYRRGIAKHQTGADDEAREDLDKATNLDSKLADAWYVIGNLEAGRGQSDVAVAAYAKAVEIQPEHAAAWYNRGNLLFSQSKMQQSIDCWTIAITLQPEMFRAYNNRAAAYDHMGRQVEAVADYEKTLQLNPGFVRAWDNLAWLLATSDKKEIRDAQRALKLAAKACELSDFKDWTCLNTLAMCSSENQDFDSAVKWAKAARAIAPAAEHSELDQVVSTYETQVKSKRIATKTGGQFR